MDWKNLEGLTVKAMYLGEYPVVGKVERSWVRRGRDVCHNVVLDTPIKIRKWTYDGVTLDHKDVVEVMG